MTQGLFQGLNRKEISKVFLSLRLTLQLKRSLGGYSHRERCRAPDRTHKEVKSQCIREESKTLQAVKGNKGHFTSPEGVEGIQKESKTLRSRRQRITRIENTILQVINYSLDPAQRLNYIWIEGSSYYKRELPKELRLLHVRP